MKLLAEKPVECIAAILVRQRLLAERKNLGLQVKEFGCFVLR